MLTAARLGVISLADLVGSRAGTLHSLPSYLAARVGGLTASRRPSLTTSNRKSLQRQRRIGLQLVFGGSEASSPLITAASAYVCCVALLFLALWRKQQQPESQSQVDLLILLTPNLETFNLRPQAASRKLTTEAILVRKSSIGR